VERAKVKSVMSASIRKADVRLQARAVTGEIRRSPARARTRWEIGDKKGGKLDPARGCWREKESGWLLILIMFGCMKRRVWVLGTKRKIGRPELTITSVRVRKDMAGAC
jgi:hypothetical protein